MVRPSHTRELLINPLYVGTMAELADRKQTYKLSMFRTLYRILLIAVIIIGAFFVVSSMSFSNRLDEGTTA